MADENKWFSFDPTIHAGHIFIAAGIIASSIGMYYAVKSDITTLISENVSRKLEIAEIRADAKNHEAADSVKFDYVVQMQRNEVAKLRDDMNNWFMNLDQKLDRKADKR